MKTLKINHSWILVLIVVGAFFLMPLSVSASDAVAKENPKFVELASQPSIKYEDISGMVKNASEVSISVVLTNFSKEIEGDKSELFFRSDLEDTVWGISIDGSPKEYRSPFTIDHGKAGEVRITLTGKAPEVNKRKEDVTLLNITQKITDEYSVIDIKKDVTSGIAEDALNAWYIAKKEIDKANWIIINATEDGVDVSDAETTLELANKCLNNSYRLYLDDSPEEALEEAELAENHAKEAELKARAVIELTMYRTYSILVVVAGIVIAALIFLRVKRGRKRGIY